MRWLEWGGSLQRLREAGLRLAKFLLVGTFGLAMSAVVLWALHGVAEMPLATASPVAITAAMFGTFCLNECWTWRNRPRTRSGLAARVGCYVLINSIGMLINWQILMFLHGRERIHYQLANLTGAAVAAIWNFFFHNLLTWRG